MAEITIRVRTPAQMMRVQMKSGASVADLRAQISALMSCAPAKLKLSLKPDYSSPLSDSAKLVGPDWPNGAMVYADDVSRAQAAAAIPSPAKPAAPAANAAVATTESPAKRRQLTPRCTHGPNGMCTHCITITDDDLKALKDEPLNKAARFAPRHVEKSVAAGANEVTGDLEWLCRHRPDQMCINCAPLKKGEKVELEMLCQHGPGGRCTNCLPPESTVTDRKYITYGEWDGARRARCEHGPSAMCPNCTPPAAVSYKLKPNCAKHRPWPGGLCSDCAPPLADLKAQPYRHVDYVQFNNRAELEGFINLWSANERAGVQRAAWLYGYIAPDPNYPSGTKVVVEALYEPPQVWDPPTGAIKILPDTRQAHADALAAAMGLRRVGWMFTKKPLVEGSNEPTVSPRELQAMAALQNAFPNPTKLPNGAQAPGSQFVTVVVRKTKDGIEPLGYMGTDQMQALVRDGVTADATTADQKMRVKQQLAGQPPVPEVILSSNLRGRQRGVQEFDVEIGLVTLEVGMPRGAPSDPTTVPRFKHHGVFPVENRRDFGVEQRPADIAKILKAYKNEPMQSAIAEWHALLYLVQAFDIDTACSIAASVAKGKEIEEGWKLMIQHLA